MVHVITNSRRFATDKLLSAYGLSAPFTSVRFVEKLEDLPVASASHPAPAIFIWQRGRMSASTQMLRAAAAEAFATKLYRHPTKQELEP